MTEQELKVTLCDIGFEPDEVETYVRLVREGDCTCAQRMLMLGEKRRGMLDEIHSREKLLDRLDYLRYEIRKTRAS